MILKLLIGFFIYILVTFVFFRCHQKTSGVVFCHQLSDHDPKTISNDFQWRWKFTEICHKIAAKTTFLPQTHRKSANSFDNHQFNRYSDFQARYQKPSASQITCLFCAAGCLFGFFYCTTALSAKRSESEANHSRVYILSLSRSTSLSLSSLTPSPLFSRSFSLYLSCLQFCFDLWCLWKAARQPSSRGSSIRERASAVFCSLFRSQFTPPPATDSTPSTQLACRCSRPASHPSHPTRYLLSPAVGAAQRREARDGGRPAWFTASKRVP